MEWEVTIKYDTKEKTYPISADRDYGARIAAVEMFLEEYMLPGAAVEYVSGRKKGTFEIMVRAAVDGRRISRYGPSTEFFSEQIGKMRKWVREGGFTEEKKVKATRLLLELEEVLGG